MAHKLSLVPSIGQFKSGVWPMPPQHKAPLNQYQVSFQRF
ncbi:hypothetical protein PIIN_10302 [Serendipita indica DSM 11827]|uniref:Uncharacterized protein n=1 Tax=Serendipita indica (strain DSM 11827) TaxID=1109443 RepID=G4TYB4_SERID|nr:hypothetical protein PIIN_10302 [Serendipita indica DSM 11827]